MSTPDEAPDYVPSPFASEVHNQQRISQSDGLSQDAQGGMRNKLIESILQIVVQAITGILLPGPLGAAFNQLSDWATNIADQLTDILLQIPIIGDIVQWLAGLLGIDVGDVGDPGIDFGDIWSNVVNVFINPLGFFANLVSGLVPGLQIPGIDASKIVSGFIGDGLMPVINSIIGGITGLIPDFFGTHDDVQNAAASQTAVLGAISAAVARLEASFADLDPATVLVEEDFEYTAGAPDPAKWDISYSTGDGHQEVDGHQLKWGKSGSLRNQATMRFIGGADAESTDDDMTIKIVVGSNVMPDTQPGSPNSIDVLGRMNSAKTTYVRLRVFKASYQLQAVNSGTTTIIATQAIGVVGVGGIISLQCGDASNHRNFFVTINGTTWGFFDGASVSQVGSGFRWRGMGQLAGQVVFFGLTFQENAGPVAHWASQNAA